MKYFKEWWNSWHVHKWMIIYYSPTGLFVEVECAKCGARDHRGA